MVSNPARIGVDGKILAVRRPTPIRDHVNRRRSELKKERDAVPFAERVPIIQEHLTDWLAELAQDRFWRRLDAFKAVLRYRSEQRQNEADTIVAELRKNIETCLEMDGWEAGDIKTLLNTRLDLHPGQVRPEPEKEPPKLPSLTIRLGEVYGTWKSKAAPDQSLNRYPTIPGGKRNEE